MKFIENSNEGVHCYNRFSADYSDDIVRINKAEFEAAKEYIMDCYERAQTDFDYASEQYGTNSD